MNLKNGDFKNGEKVKLKGSALYNGGYYPLKSTGTIVELREDNSLVIIDKLYKYPNVTQYVSNNYIFKLK